MTKNIEIKDNLLKAIDNIEKPSDVIVIKLNNNPKEIMMTGGLIRTIAPLVGALEDFGNAFADPNLQNIMVAEVLADRTPRGNPVDDVLDVANLNISIDEYSRLVSWIMEHVLYFFVKSLKEVNKMYEKAHPLMEAMMAHSQQSQDGSQT